MKGRSWERKWDIKMYNSRTLYFCLIKLKFNWRWKCVTKKREVSSLYKFPHEKCVFADDWQGSECERRRESNNKRQVNAMMRRNLFISKLWPLSFSAEGTLVDGWSKLSLARASKCFSETSLRYIAPIFRQEQRIDKRHESSSEAARSLFPVLSLMRCFATWYTRSPGTCASRRKECILPGIRDEVTPGKVSEKENVPFV